MQRLRRMEVVFLTAVLLDVLGRLRTQSWVSSTHWFAGVVWLLAGVLISVPIVTTAVESRGRRRLGLAILAFASAAAAAGMARDFGWARILFAVTSLATLGIALWLLLSGTLRSETRAT